MPITPTVTLQRLDRGTIQDIDGLDNGSKIKSDKS